MKARAVYRRCHLFFLLNRIATAASLNGPWRRLDKPLFGPDPKAWDNIDVSNPSPIIHGDGSVVLMYKGRGKKAQHMGLATAPTVDGPYTRNGSLQELPDLPGEDPWGWIDPKTHTYHAVFHTGNGEDSAGTHCWSADGKVWHGQNSPPAYTGHMSWADDTVQPYAGKETVLARRERPQILLAGEAGNGSSYGIPHLLFTSAEDCVYDHMPDGGFGETCSVVKKDDKAVGTTKSYTVVAEVVR